MSPAGRWARPRARSSASRGPARGFLIRATSQSLTASVRLCCSAATVGRALLLRAGPPPREEEGSSLPCVAPVPGMPTALSGSPARLYRHIKADVAVRLSARRGDGREGARVAGVGQLGGRNVRHGGVEGRSPRRERRVDSAGDVREHGVFALGASDERHVRWERAPARRVAAQHDVLRLGVGVDPVQRRRRVLYPEVRETEGAVTTARAVVHDAFVGEVGPGNSRIAVAVAPPRLRVTVSRLDGYRV